MKKSGKQNISGLEYSTRNGVVYIWVIVTLLLLVLLTGLTLDIGKVVFVAQQLQNAADASALAGARIVKISQNQARQNAMDIALLNYADGQYIQLRDNEEMV